MDNKVYTLKQKIGSSILGQLITLPLDFNLWYFNESYWMIIVLKCMVLLCLNQSPNIGTFMQNWSPLYINKYQFPNIGLFVLFCQKWCLTQGMFLSSAFTRNSSNCYNFSLWCRTVIKWVYLFDHKAPITVSGDNSA
jgi:hypothetical protein